MRAWANEYPQGMALNGVPPQVSWWYPTFTTNPVVDAFTAFRREYQVRQGDLKENVPLGGKKLGGENDIETLQELAQRLMDLGRVAYHTDEEASKVGEVKSSPKETDEIAIIYL